MIFLFPRWDMLIPWRVLLIQWSLKTKRLEFSCWWTATTWAQVMVIQHLLLFRARKKHRFQVVQYYVLTYPIGSMYGIYTYMNGWFCGKCMVNTPVPWIVWVLTYCLIFGMQYSCAVICKRVSEQNTPTSLAWFGTAPSPSSDFAVRDLGIQVHFRSVASWWAWSGHFTTAGNSGDGLKWFEVANLVKKSRWHEPCHLFQCINLAMASACFSYGWWGFWVTGFWAEAERRATTRTRGGLPVRLLWLGGKQVL